MRRKIIAGCLVALAALSAVSGSLAGAAAPASTAGRCIVLTDRNHLAVDATQPGVISLNFSGAGSARVVFFECVSGRLHPLGARQATSVNTFTSFVDAASWSCQRRSRQFQAVAELPGGAVIAGTMGVRTPSCARRFDVQVTRRVAVGATARIRILDRWRIGAVHPRLCVTPPAGPRSCRTIAFAPAVAIATHRLRMTRPGRWHVDLRIRGFHVRSSVTAGGGRLARVKALPRLLATGDSTMQSVDSFLEDELAGTFAVRSDVRLGVGISRSPFWPKLAITQTRRQRQSVTVMSVGAAIDGFPMTTPGGQQVACCERPWIDEYARRTRSIMQTYSRQARARVYWLTVVAPRRPDFARVASAINVAFLLAAAPLRSVSVIRTDLIFSPNGYQDTIRYRGRDIAVREPDGIHLNTSGTAIVAKVIAQAIRTPPAAGE